MKLETIGTSTFVGSKTVLTSFLTSAIIITLIVVNTESSRLVQFISTWTHAPETSVRVLTRAGRGTQPRLLHALVHVEAPVAVLLVAGRTHAHVAALRVDALVLTDVPARATLVRVTTRPPVTVQFITRRTAALVGSKRIETFMLTRFRFLKK